MGMPRDLVMITEHNFQISYTHLVLASIYLHVTAVDACPGNQQNSTQGRSFNLNTDRR